ncbi:MAG: hypothetical protein IJE76_01240 [Bacteroidales bacterium]|nr:hypothetical protein [Bacteroidales bacterium]
MDYIRIKTASRDSETQRLRDATSASSSMSMSESESASESTANDIKELLKDWIKLYPDSFSPDMEFKIYQLEDGDIIIRLHEDMSSLAVALLVLYLETTGKAAVSESVSVSQSSIANSQWPMAFITIDDTEVLLKQNVGKRAMLFCETTRQQDNKSTSIDSESQSLRDAKSLSLSKSESLSTTVRFLLDDNYVLDYDFERRPQPVKNSGLQFEEQELTLPKDYDVVRVGDVVKKKIDKVLEDEGLTPKKMLIYLLCGAIGLAIGFLIVHFSAK